MGCCCSSAMSMGAFPRLSPNSQLVETLLPELKLDTSRVFVIRLIGLNKISVGNYYQGWSDAFVQFTLKPVDPIVRKPQVQTSSIMPSTLNPRWVSTFSYLEMQYSQLFSLYLIFNVLYDLLGTTRTFPIHRKQPKGIIYCCFCVRYLV
jgi:hypothetical protein